jgi:hypothetical protein
MKIFKKSMKIFEGYKTKKIQYGLYHLQENKILKIQRYFANYIDNKKERYILTLNEENREWKINNPFLVEYTRRYKNPWFNSDFEFPENVFDPNLLITIKIESKEYITPITINIPEKEEILDDENIDKEFINKIKRLDYINLSLKESKFNIEREEIINEIKRLNLKLEELEKKIS